MSRMNWGIFEELLQLARQAHRRDVLPNQRKSEVRIGHYRPPHAWETLTGDRPLPAHTYNIDTTTWVRSERGFDSSRKDPILELGKQGGSFNRQKIHLTSDINSSIDGEIVSDAPAERSQDALRTLDNSPMLEQPEADNETSRYGTNKTGIIFQQRLRIFPDFTALGAAPYNHRSILQHYSTTSDGETNGGWNKVNSAIEQGLTYEYHDFDYSAPWVFSNPGAHRAINRLSAGTSVKLNPEFNFYSEKHQTATEALAAHDYKIPSIFFTPSQDNLGRNFESFTQDVYSSSEPGWNTNGTPSRFIVSEEETNFLHGEGQEKKLQYPWYIEMEIDTPPPGPFMRSIRKRGLEGIIIEEISNQFANPTDFHSNRSATIQHEAYNDDEGEKIIFSDNARNIASVDFYGNSTSLFENIMTRLSNNDLGGERTCNTYLDRISMLSLRSEFNRAVSARQNRIPYAATIAGTPCPTETLFYKIRKNHWSVGGDDNQPIAISDSENDIYIANSKQEALKYIDTQVKRDRNYSYSITAYIMVYGIAYRYKQTSEEVFNLSPNIDDPPLVPLIALQGGQGLASIVPPLVDALVHYSPSIRIFEVELYDEDLYRRALSALMNDGNDNADVEGLRFPKLRIIDRPPVAPNVTVLPYRGRNDEILINLEENIESLGIGTTGYPFLPLKEGDNDIFRQIRRHQLMYENPLLHRGKLEFRGEGDMAKVEVYRTTKTPVIHGSGYNPNRERDEWLVEHASPYSVFVEESDTPYKLIDYSIQTAFKDTIRPNTPYYYTFRALDRGSPSRPDGYFSNPSPIYRVELVDNNGMIYALIDTYEPKRATKPEIARSSLVRYLEIKPSLLTSEVGYDAPFDGTAIGLVDGEGSAFGKTFKVRIKSTDTGRIVDINMSFATAVSTSDGEDLPEVATPAPCPPPEE